jgi:hypothetical protein
MKPPAPRSKKSRPAFCSLPLLLLIGAIQFLVIYSPAIDRYMVMVTKGTASALHCRLHFSASPS